MRAGVESAPCGRLLHQRCCAAAGALLLIPVTLLGLQHLDTLKLGLAFGRVPCCFRWDQPCQGNKHLVELPLKVFPSG